MTQEEKKRLIDKTVKKIIPLLSLPKFATRSKKAQFDGIIPFSLYQDLKIHILSGS